MSFGKRSAWPLSKPFRLTAIQTGERLSADRAPAPIRVTPVVTRNAIRARDREMTYETGEARKSFGAHGATEHTNLIVGRDVEAKMRVTSTFWENAKVLGKNGVPEARNADGRLRIARKERHHDEWDPKIEPHDPYGPGAFVTRNAGSVTGHASSMTRHAHGVLFADE